MKIKKPEIIPMFKCSLGPPVESLPLWKRSELTSRIVERLPQISDDQIRAAIVDMLIEDSEDIIAILWLKEKGRPNGAKDKKPRVKRTAESAAEKAA